MKKLVFVLTVMIFGTLSLSAQEATMEKKSCSKKSTACCASKAKAAGTAGTAETKVLSAAESLADAQEDITKRVCAESGSTSFYKKAVCSTSGKISYQEVEFDAEKNQFVNVSPNDIGDANEAGTIIKAVNMENVKVDAKKGVTAAADKKMAKKACCADGAKKACCSKDGAKKACSKDGAKKACSKEGAKKAQEN